jgi:hypothetical protein
MYVRVEPSCEAKTGMELFATIARKSFSAEFETSIDKLDIRTFAESVVNDCFVLVYCDRTG